jgi:acyl-CoA synthetase (AMP-forming)/AMP-acid ligase II
MHPSVHAKTQPDKAAYIMAGSGETVTYGDLEERSNRGAQLFRKLGLKTGDGIAVLMENNVHYLPVCWAAQRAGLFYTCISSRLTASEVEYIVKDCGAKVFLSSSSMGEITGELVTRLPGVHMLMFGGIAPGYTSAEAELAKMPGTPISDESAGSDMLYSSGTTGRPKGVKGVLTGAKLTDPNALVMLAKMLYNFDEQTTYLSPAPLYHAAPLRYNMTVQRLGGTCIVMEHFDPSEALRLIGKYTATHSQWVPTMFVRMLKLPEAERRRHDVSSMKVAIHAAAPCPIPVKKQMIEWWGPVIFEYYAGTEGNGFCAINSQDWLAHPGSVGKSLLGELHIVGEDGAECPTGEPGTIYFANGPAFEYHNDPGKTADARNQQGWSTLGDVGYVDKDGYLYLTDRKAFMIISGGVNIYPQEAENVLINHPKVADVAVIGIPNEDFGEEVKAVVQPMLWSDATPELAAELIAYCREHLSQIKCPRTVDFEPELPRHPTGKLYKRLIRDRYWGNRESKIV